MGACRDHKSAGAVLLGSLLLSACAASSVSFKHPLDPSDPVAATRRVADRVLALYDPARRDWGWGEACEMMGMMAAWRTTGDGRYRAYVEKWCDHHIRTGIPQHWANDLSGLAAMSDLLARADPWVPHGLDKWYAYVPHLRAMREWQEKILPRTSDGGIIEIPKTRQLWVDAMFVHGCFLARYGRATCGQPCFEEASRQLLVHAKHLQDPQTGLFHHMYDEATGKVTEPYWGRGNGWAVLSMSETLEAAPEDLAGRDEMMKRFRTLVAALRPHQDPATGLWRTIVDRPDAYLEGSGSGFFVYGMAKGLRHGWLDASYRETVDRGWKGLCGLVNDDGDVTQVSIRTGPGDPAKYLAVERGIRPWGTCAFLLAAEEMAWRSRAASQ